MKRKATTIFLLSVFFISVLMVSGCSLIADKATEKAVENAMEQGGAKDAKVDLKKGEVEVTTPEGKTKVGGTYEWPSSIPSDVPRLSSGKISMIAENSSEGEKTIMVYYEGVDAAAGENYKGLLEQAGWKMTMVNKSADGSYMSVAEKGKRSVNLVLTTDATSKVTGGWIAYNEKTE